MSELTGHTTSEAYRLAMEYIHKPWARRWLNANGYRWAASIYRERQKHHRSDENHLTSENNNG